MPKGWKRTTLYTGYVLLVTFFLLEIGVRLWGYSERHIYDPIYEPFEPGGDIPYVHKPNLIQAHARGLAIINTDSLGLRAKTSGEAYGPKQPDEYRVAIVGDSNTFGEGIPKTEDTYAQILEDILNHQQHAKTVKVFNFGASAYSVKQMAATLQHRMVKIQPDLVVMSIIPNDLNLSRTPTIDRKGYLVDQKISVLLDSPFGNVLRSVHLLYIIREIAIRWILPSQNIVPLLLHSEIPDSYRYIRQFKEIADLFELPSVVVLLPQRQDKSWGHLPERLSKDKIRYLDLSYLSTEFTAEQYMASRFDRHASPAVHRRIGESLASYIPTQMESRL